MKADYSPLPGKLARQLLKELGYPCANDHAEQCVMGLLVAMAEEIEALRSRVEQLEERP